MHLRGLLQRNLPGLPERRTAVKCSIVKKAGAGGVTFGGGEPLLHSGQISAFAELCPEEWNITLETSLNVPSDLLMPLLTERFFFIVDIKAVQPEIYLQYTGQDNRPALENLSLLCRRLPPDHYVVKLPLIPGYSGRDEAAASSEKLRALGIPAGNISVFSYINGI